MKKYTLTLTDSQENVIRQWNSDLDFSWPIREFDRDKLADEINYEIGLDSKVLYDVKKFDEWWTKRLQKIKELFKK